MSNLTAVSLFAGVGGFDLAMQRNGIEVVAAVEIDKNCREVLTKKFPKTKLFNDVKEVTGEQLKSAGFIPKRGIITGGFPCQDLSIAGLRKGLAGERSGLFHQIIRLVDELEPKFVILENVSGLLSSQSGRDMGIVITALVERGYGVCWRVLDSQNFGVPQRRRRVFIVASLGNHRQPVEILFESESSQWDFEKITKKRQRTTATTKTGIDQDSRSAINNNSTATLLRMRGGKEGGGKGALVSEDKSLTIATGNDQTLFLFQGNRVGDPRFYDNGISPTVMSRWGTAGNNVPLTYTKQSFGEYKELNVASTMSRRDYLDATDLIVEPVIPIHDQATRFSGQSKRGKGNGLGIGKENDPSPTLSTQDRHAIFNNQIVRRLTPKECERLQGFPDGWTDGQADSNRYKQLGNAVTVNVVDWIMKRLVNLVE
jgi:DNA (cytosine-5)-methyltransferase 1